MVGLLGRVERISAAADDERTFRITVVDELRREVGFDHFAWLLTDPVTEVGSAPLADVPSIDDLPRLIRAKYLCPLNRWTGLGAGAVSLRAATRGELSASSWWREILAGYDIVDVLSVVFRDAHGCWGWLDLWRQAPAEPFDDGAIRSAAALVGPVTAALRRTLGATFTDEPVPVPPGPSVLVLAPDLTVRAQTAESEAYLRAMLPPDGDRRPVPAAALNVAAQLLTVEAGVDRHPPSARSHVGAGRWVTVRAARAAETDDPIVTIEPCPAGERRDLFARCHGLSNRENEIVERLARGADTRTIAADLFLSALTVQDHLKSVFAKTGTHSRRELVARASGV